MIEFRRFASSYGFALATGLPRKGPPRLLAPPSSRSAPTCPAREPSPTPPPATSASRMRES
eukprot:8984363-Pyramimonas_sp.AAC.1